MQNREAIDRALNEIFDAERIVRRVHDELAASKQPDRVIEALVAAVETSAREPDEAEASLRLVRVSALLGEFEGPRVVDALIDILATEHPEARRAAGEELENLAYDRFKEVATGVERALKRLPVGSPALPELPYLLAEIPENGVIKLLGLFLAHEDADAVAAAIEAIVEIGDPTAVRFLEPLVGDDRAVEMADEGDDDTTNEITIGELAEEAIGLLDEGEDDEES